MDVGKMIAIHEVISQHMLMAMGDDERQKYFAHVVFKLMGKVTEKIVEELFVSGKVQDMKMDIRYGINIGKTGPLEGDLDVQLTAQLMEVSTMPMSYRLEPRIEEYLRGKPISPIDIERPFSFNPLTHWSASYVPGPIRPPKDPEEVTDPKVAGTAMTMDEILKRIKEGPSLSSMLGIDMAHVDKIEGPDEPKGETDDNHKLMWRGKEIK